MIRAMLTAFPESPELYGADDQYMLGDALLVKPVTHAMKDGGDETEVMLPPGGWYDLFTKDYFEGGQTIRISTPLERFPVFVRAGSILPTAEGAQCAADLPVPARELSVFGGADGSLMLYDDAGDGYEPGMLIPVRYEDAGSVLYLDRMTGEMPEAIEITIQLYRPDGSRDSRKVRYDGNGIPFRIGR